MTKIAATINRVPEIANEYLLDICRQKPALVIVPLEDGHYKSLSLLENGKLAPIFFSYRFTLNSSIPPDAFSRFGLK
jgi:hypothetical protein